jgi:hypothetical protein
VPITILRAQAAAARLFFGKIGGGRDLVRSHFFFAVNEKQAIAPGNRAPRFRRRFAAGSPQRNHMRSMPERAVARAIERKCLTRRSNSPAPARRARSPWRSST